MRFFFLVIIFFSMQLNAAEPIADVHDSYRAIELTTFVDSNQISQQMASKKQRLMLQPEPVKFEAMLMSAPKAGEFSLAYDALQLWQGDAELPNIDHSAFVGVEGGPVLSPMKRRKC